MTRKEQLILAGLALFLFALQSWVTYTYLVAPHPGANDFYSRWAGAHAYLVEGRNPYDLKVTEEIQKVLNIDPKRVGNSGFHYPLHVLFTFWPLVYLPYPWAQAIWQTLLIWVTGGVVGVMLRWLKWKPSPLGMAALILTAVFFYPAARSMLLGQFTLHVTLFLALCLLALQNKQDGWAGVALAATSIKPQMVVVVGLFLVLWAISQKRWRFVYGVLGGGLFFLVASMLVYPPWVLRFLEDNRRYADTAGGKSPLALIVGYTHLPVAVEWVLAALLVGPMLWAWVRARDGKAGSFELALTWSLVVTLLVPFQTGTTNQALLLIPLVAWLYVGVKRLGVGVTAVLVVLLNVAVWQLFFALLSGDYENPVQFLPLPLLTLFFLLLQEYAAWRQVAPQPE